MPKAISNLISDELLPAKVGLKCLILNFLHNSPNICIWKHGQILICYIRSKRYPVGSLCIFLYLSFVRVLSHPPEQEQDNQLECEMSFKAWLGPDWRRSGNSVCGEHLVGAAVDQHHCHWPPKSPDTLSHQDQDQDQDQNQDQDHVTRWVLPDPPQSKFTHP